MRIRLTKAVAQALGIATAKRRKYGNMPQSIDGRRFASKREAARYGELRRLEKAGRIQQLRCQVSYPLTVDGQLVCRYVADFVYLEHGREIVEDAKGVRTPLYKVKRRLMLILRKIAIREV